MFVTSFFLKTLQRQPNIKCINTKHYLASKLISAYRSVSLFLFLVQSISFFFSLFPFVRTSVEAGQRGSDACRTTLGGGASSRVG